MLLDNRVNLITGGTLTNWLQGPSAGGPLSSVSQSEALQAPLAWYLAVKKHLTTSVSLDITGY
jgi:hypothetical protein